MASKTPVVPPDLTYHDGTAILLPSLPKPMDIPSAVNWLQKIQAEQSTHVAVMERIPCFPWDGARALTRALTEQFGAVVATKSIFSRQHMIDVATDVGVTEPVVWGEFDLPDDMGTVECDSGRDDSGHACFVLSAYVQKRHVPVVRELADRVRRLVRESSIYRGKAIRFVSQEHGPVAPAFIDLTGVADTQLVLPDEIMEQVEVSLFTPIRALPMLRTTGTPFRSGVALVGPYGTGKTLAILSAARLARAHGITFVLADADDLADALEFARQYAPAVVACEDIDQVTKTRDSKCEAIMAALDGLESKSAGDVMTVFTSNHADQIHPAMRRTGRIDTWIPFGPPDADTIVRLIQQYGADVLTDGDYRPAAQLLADGRHIPSDVAEVVRLAKRAAISRMVRDAGGTVDLAGVVMLTPADILTSARRLRMRDAVFASAETTTANPRDLEVAGMVGRTLAAGIASAVLPVPGRESLKMSDLPHLRDTRAN